MIGGGLVACMRLWTVFVGNIDSLLLVLGTDERVM